MDVTWEGSGVLRVLFVMPANVESPSAYHITWFAEELARLGHRSLIAFYGDPAVALAEKFEPPHGVDCFWYQHRARGLRKSSLDRAIHFRPSLIHVWSARVPAVAAAIAFHRATAAPVLVHWEDDEWSLREGSAGRPLHRVVGFRLRRLLAPVYPPLGLGFTSPASLRWIADHAAGLDALTAPLAEEIESRLGRRCTVIRPATPRSALGPSTTPVKLPIEADGKRVVAITGTVGPESIGDIEVALLAIAQLQRAGRDTVFVHTGYTLPRYDLDELARRCGVAPGTAVFLGRVPFDRMLALLARADVLLQPGRATRFNRLRLPSKLQAYLASGTPTITFACGFGEELVDRTEVLKLQEGTAGELATRIAEIVDDPHLADELAAGAKHASERLFDQAANTRALVNYYVGALTAGGHGGQQR